MEALNLPWANHKTKMLILIGNDGVGVVRDPSLANEIGKLSTLGGNLDALEEFVLTERFSESLCVPSLSTLLVGNRSQRIKLNNKIVMNNFLAISFELVLL